MKMTQLTPKDVEHLINTLILDKKELESRGQWVRVEWIPDIGVYLKWGQVLSNGMHEAEIATREYFFRDGQIVAHTTYHS